MTELLIVVAILGLLAVVAIPSFSGYKTRIEKTELIKLANIFFDMAEDCLLDLEIGECGGSALGFKCSGCEGPEASPAAAADTLSMLVKVNDTGACATFKSATDKNLFMKGICHKAAPGGAIFPIKLCKVNTDCGTGGETCYSGSFSLSGAKPNRVCAG